MARLKSPLVIFLVCLVSAFLPHDTIVFLMDCLMIAHVYVVSLEMTLVVIVLILAITTLYYGFKLGDSYLTALTSLAFLFRIPYVVPLPIGPDRSLVSVVPVRHGAFLYYLLIYVKQNTGILAVSNGSMDTVQKCSRIPKSVLSNRATMVMTATYAMGTIAVHLMRRLFTDYIWVVAIVVGAAVELLAVFVGDFVFGVSIPMDQMVLGLALSATIVVVFNLFVLSVDYTRTEYMQFGDDDYYYYVKVVPKTIASTPDVRVQKISTCKRGTREGDPY